MLPKIKILIAAILCFSKMIVAIEPHEDLYFRSMRIKDGLPGSTILSIQQDHFGFIWIGTNDGLCRYDGSTFRIFRHEPGEEQSLSDNYIQNLFFDSTGNLWILTGGGLDYLNLQTQELKHYLANGKPGSIADDSSIDMIETPDGKLFIASYYQGISWKNIEDEKFNYLKEGENGLSSNWINCLDLINDSLLIIGYREFGIDIYNIETGNIQTLDKLIDVPLASYRINAIQNDNSGGFWLGTTEGLSHINLQKKQVTNFSYNNDLRGFLPDNDIMSLNLDKEGFLWIGSRNNGLVIAKSDDILNKGNNAPYVSYTQDYMPGGLSYRSISTIFKDRDGQVWIGTHGGGINLAEKRMERFGHLMYEKGVENSLSYNKVWGVTEDSNGHIWLGTDGDGVNIWDPDLGMIKYYRHEKNNPNSLSDNAVISACTDWQGQVWLGTYEGGINRFDPKTNQFYHYQAPNDIRVNDVRCIYQDKSNELWIGMNRGGLAKYNPESDEFLSAANLSEYDIRSLLRIGDDLWIGTFGNGLIRFNLTAKTIKVFYPDAEKSEGISSSTIYSMCSVNDTILFIGTRYGGLLELNLKTEKFQIFTEKDGLANNTIHSILSDSNENLWLSTNNGISKFEIQKKVFTNYGWQSGVQSEEFHNGSGLITKSGLFCFGGIQGLNYFDPGNFQSSKFKDNIQFTGLKILDNEVKPEPGGIIEKSIEFRPKVKLNYTHSVITIGFQSVKNPFSEEKYYEYFLDGYDENWNKAGKLTSATYRNLPPGNYIFRVKTYKNNEQIQSEEATLLISMAPPFWKTWWAYIFYVFLVVAIISLIFRYRVQQYKIKNRLVYEQRLRNEEKKLHNERLDFFTNISHELRTPLTIIGVAIDELKSIRLSNPKLKKSLDAAAKNSNRLMELINRLLEFRQTETGVSSMAVKKLNLNLFIPDFLQGFREMARHNSVNLKITLPINDVYLWVDTDKFTMILNNLLSNAFKHTPSGGHILLSVDESEKHIILKVEDSGEGIAPQVQDKIFKRYFKLDSESTSTGIGLALTKSLVDFHQAEIGVESKLGKGACFTIHFLKGNSHFAASQLIHEENAIIDEETLQENQLEEESLMENSTKKIILIIDDNQEILELLSDKFDNEYQILKASDGKEGVSLAKKYIPDLVISDIMMPVMNGTEVCMELKNDSSTSHIPIIMLTAKGTEEDEIKGLDTGADDYISKPFKVNVLKARVRTLIENRIKLLNYFNHKTETEEELVTDTKKEKELTFLKKIEDYILENCLISEVSVFDLAADLGYSRTTLYRKIKMLTGESINGFVRSVKLKKSAQLIREGLNVSEAAYSTGFNDLKYFRESFKKLYGKNPSDLKT